jgi:chromosome segregation ATPase
MRHLFLLSLVVLLAMFISSAHSADDAKNEHAVMKKDHVRVHQEHDQLLRQIGKWKVEHRRALATLAEVQARILNHEAALEELAEHAREHEDHIEHHDEEIAMHDKEGSDKDHAKLADAHKKLIDEHAKVMKVSSELEDNHEQLMQLLGKLQELIVKKKS